MILQSHIVESMVREKLFALPISERDLVVKNSTPKSLTAADSAQAGANFPVFLYPEAHFNYALDRTESDV